MSTNPMLDWNHWDPLELFEEDRSLLWYAQIAQGDESLRQRHWDTAEACYMRVLEGAHAGANLLVEACARCHLAEVGRRRGNWTYAIADYGEALYLYHLQAQYHNEAVSHLMLGLCHQGSGDATLALAHYADAFELFRRLAETSRARSERAHTARYEAYCELVRLLHSQVASAPMSGATLQRPPTKIIPSPDETAARAPNYFPSPEDAPDEPETNAHDEWSLIGIIPIVGDLISAGSGTSLGEEDDTVGYVESDGLRIGNEYYSVSGLSPQQNHICFARDARYVCTRVRGDSMDREGIQPGDYILVEQPLGVPYVPRNRDIVAVIVDGESDRLGLLKRVVLDSGGIRLAPSSFNTAHKPRTFSTEQARHRLHFRGKVIAVLKRRTAV